jgi:hypothetical protein
MTALQAAVESPAVGSRFPLSGRICVVVATLLPACTGSRQPLLVTVPDPALRPVFRLEGIFDHGTAAATVAAIFERDLGFVGFPVVFHFQPNREMFEKALLASGYDESLARSTARTMTAVGGYRAVLLNGAAFGALPVTGQVAMLAHELGHSLQYELGGGRRGASDQWLREGFADWLAVRVLERLDAAPMADVRRERQSQLRSTGRSKTPRLAELVTFRQWVDAGERFGPAAYTWSFLAVDFLLERHGMAAVVTYFRLFATSQNRLGNFRKAFDEDLETFEAELERRLWRGTSR